LKAYSSGGIYSKMSGCGMEVENTLKLCAAGFAADL
jgi:hypothetical protein